jgi:hypothetical protein
MNFNFEVYFSVKARTDFVPRVYFVIIFYFLKLSNSISSEKHKEVQP